MRMAVLVAVATFVAGCGTRGTGNVPGCADAGPDLNEYTLIRRSCSSCALTDLASAAAGPGAQACGDFANSDAGAEACVWAAIDAGRPFIAYGLDRGTDPNSTTSYAFTRDPSGASRIFAYESVGRPSMCDRFVTELSCASFVGSAAGLTCAGGTQTLAPCDESRSSVSTDAGLRPLSELHCPDSYESCWIDSSNPAGAVACRYSLVCIETEYGVSCATSAYRWPDGG